MDVLLGIGEFSKMTYLTVKALRHYHDVGLLEPAHIDPATGYRHYLPEQVGHAHAIRRFRDLDMPLDEIREVLAAPTPEARDEAILQHLARLQDQLERAQTSIGALQALLRQPRLLQPVDERVLPPTLALLMTETVAFADAAAWCDAVFPELHAALDEGAADGPDTALYSPAFFEDGVGTCTAFVAIGRAVRASGRLEVAEVAGGRVAVMRHEGPFADLDQTYGALGTVVAERGDGADGPIRECYLTSTATDVCWPLTG